MPVATATASPRAHHQAPGPISARCQPDSPARPPKRRGNPTLALVPRCGARTRAGCPCRAPAIHDKLRCRMHGGRSTGPRTEDGLARLRAARTTHGHYTREARAWRRHVLTLTRRTRMFVAALQCETRLPPEMAQRLLAQPPELALPSYRAAGLSCAEDRMVLQAEREALLPWKQSIAAARQAGRQPIGRGVAVRTVEGPHAPEPPDVVAPQAAPGATQAAPEPHAPIPPSVAIAPAGNALSSRAAVPPQGPASEPVHPAIAPSQHPAAETAKRPHTPEPAITPVPRPAPSSTHAAAEAPAPIPSCRLAAPADTADRPGGSTPGSRRPALPASQRPPIPTAAAARIALRPHTPEPAFGPRAGTPAPVMSLRQRYAAGTHHATTALLIESVGGPGVLANLALRTLDEA